MTCSNCGKSSENPLAKFCTHCGAKRSESISFGADVARAAVGVNADSVDNVTKYLLAIDEIVFEPDSDPRVIEKLSARLCEKFRISSDCERRLLKRFEEKKQEISSFLAIQVEFDSNVLDSYAGHDTYLRFRVTNQSIDDYFKVRLFWDDPETADAQDLSVVVPSKIKPGQSVVAGGSHIFLRSGPKEISDLRLVIENQYLEAVEFRVSSFSFKVGNIDQKVFQSISTTNTISIEGRGVIDASGIGGGTQVQTSYVADQPRWVTLSYKYSISQTADSIALELSGEAKSLLTRGPEDTLVAESIIPSVEQSVLTHSSGALPPMLEPVGSVLRDEVAKEGVCDVVAATSNQRSPNRLISINNLCSILFQLARDCDGTVFQTLVNPSIVSLKTLESVCRAVGVEAVEEVLLIAFDDSSVAALVSSGVDANIDGDVTVITPYGFFVRYNPDVPASKHPWSDFLLSGDHFYFLSVGPQPAIIKFGGEAERSHYPGMRFDFRSNGGEVSVVQISINLNRAFSAIVSSFSPETLVNACQRLPRSIGVFSVDSAPPKILRTVVGSLSSVNRGFRQDQIVLILASSKPSDPGADGLVITLDGLHVWDNKHSNGKKENPARLKSIGFKEIESATVEKGFTCWLKINGSRFFKSDSLSASDLKAIADTLAGFAQHRNLLES
jgi:hypothetical protein